MRKVHDAVHGRRERKKAQTRQAIVEAALDLFEQKGYEATTVEEIADAADVSPRTFFRYFDSKVEVTMGGSKDEREELGALLAARPADEGPLQAMRHALHESLASMFTENPHTARQMRIILATPSLRAIARDHFGEHEAEMVTEFAKRLNVPEDDLKPRVLAAVIANVIWTTHSLWVSRNAPPEELPVLLDEAYAMLAAGLE